MPANTSKSAAFYGRFLLFIAGMGGLLYGIDVGIIAAALLYLEKTISLTVEQTSFIVAAVLGGSAWLGLEAVRLTLHWLDGRGESSPLLESVYAHFDNDLMRLVIWANQANATQFAQIAPLVIEHVKRQTPLAVTLIQQAAREIDRLGSALAAQSVDKAVPCSLLGGLAQFIEPWLGESLRSRLTPCESDSVSGALLMIRKAVQDRPLAETGQE